jgi:CRISPR-associated protein Csm3
MSTRTYLQFTRSLKGYLKISAKVVNETGLLIRMPVQAQAFKIGGADQYPMVTMKKYIRRDSGEEILIEVPYIPGSSLKGRMRSLLELSLGLKLYTTDNKIWQHVRGFSQMKSYKEDFRKDVLERCPVDDLFGWAATNFQQVLELVDNDMNKAIDIFNQLAGTRLLFDDFFPSQNYIEKFSPRSIADFLEEKSENRIDRITSAADPRTIPRVRPGVEFEGSITLLFFDIDKDHVKKYIETLIYGFKLVEDTYLGSSGSRGYGRVKFRNFTLDLYKIKGSTSRLEMEGPKPIGTYADLEILKQSIDSIVGFIIKELYT